MTSKKETRIREPIEASGFLPGTRAAERKYGKYGVTSSQVSRWIKKGLVNAQLVNGVMQIEDKSLRSQIEKNYKPEKDNATKKTRNRAPSTNGNGANGPAPASPSTNGSPSNPVIIDGVTLDYADMKAYAKSLGYDSYADVPAQDKQAYFGKLRTASLIPGNAIKAGTFASDIPAGVEHNLDMPDWTDFYLRVQKDILEDSSYESTELTLRKFREAFPTFSMKDRVAGRTRVKDYLKNLMHEKTGKPLKDNSRRAKLKLIGAFFHWLDRSYGYPSPDFKGIGKELKWVFRRENAVSFRPGEMQILFRAALRPSDEMLICLMAQTGIRESGICTIRPELVHDHFTVQYGDDAGKKIPCRYVEIWDKGTGANELGYRQVPLPRESYERLKDHFAIYPELVCFNPRGKGYRLSSPIKRLDPSRPIDLNEYRDQRDPPKTFEVTPHDKNSARHLQYLITSLAVPTGIYRTGMGPHSFRRTITEEMRANGADPEDIDLILGHFSASDMGQLYDRTGIVRLYQVAEEFAPRSFLKEIAPQGELGLASD